MWNSEASVGLLTKIELPILDCFSTLSTWNYKRDGYVLISVRQLRPTAAAVLRNARRRRCECETTLSTIGLSSVRYSKRVQRRTKVGRDIESVLGVLQVDFTAEVDGDGGGRLMMDL